MPLDPWTFGWTQLLTIIGMLATAVFAFAGLKTFKKWRNEKIEERRIEIAFEALSLAFESKFVFDRIRQPVDWDIEHKDMPSIAGETPDQRQRRGGYYAVYNRMFQQLEFFDRVWKLQPKVMALFGESAEDIFVKLHVARARVAFAAQELTYRLPLDPIEPTKEEAELRRRYRTDLWGNEKGDDRVTTDLIAFRERLVELCKPVVDKEFGKGRYKGLFESFLEAAKEA